MCYIQYNPRGREGRKMSTQVMRSEKLSITGFADREAMSQGMPAASRSWKEPERDFPLESPERSEVLQTPWC